MNHSIQEQVAGALYRKGVLDGMEAVLAGLIGEEVDGMSGYEGGLDASAEKWVLQHLAAVRMARHGETA